MKKIFLYAGVGKKQYQTEIFVLVSEEDFDSLNKHKWFLMSIYHTDNKIYYARRYEGKTKLGTYKAILMHREILGLNSKDEKGDHIDGNGLNNTRSNLRVSTHAQNMSNRRSKDNSSSIYLGVNKTKSGRWAASCKSSGVVMRKCGIISEDIAALKYNEFALASKGEFARLNIIRWY